MKLPPYGLETNLEERRRQWQCTVESRNEPSLTVSQDYLNCKLSFEDRAYSNIWVLSQGEEGEREREKQERGMRERGREGKKGEGMRRGHQLEGGGGGGQSVLDGSLF